MRTLGINFETDFWPGLDEDRGLAILREAGFDCFFTDFYSDTQILERYAYAAEHNHLLWECMHAPFHGINSFWCEGEDGDRMLERLMNTVCACSRFGVRFAVVHLSSSTHPPCISDIGHKRLDLLVKEAIEKNVTVCFENLRKLANMAFVFEEYDDVPYVRFCWDTGHEACFTPGRRFMPLFGDKLAFTHINDNLCEYNGDLHLIPFDGKIDFGYVAEQLKKSGYTGTLSLELLPPESDFYRDIPPQEYYAHAYHAACRLRDMVDGPESAIITN